MNTKLIGSERLDYLIANELQIIQSQEVFSFSMDAVLLAKFASLPIKKGRIMDLCTGNGVIPLILSTRTEAQIEAVEIQERLYDMAIRSVAVNQLESRIMIHHMDLKEAPVHIGHGLFDVVTCNPPYMPAKAGVHHHNEHYAIARHEIMCCLEDVIQVSAQLLRSGGKASFVHRPSRLMDIVTLMRKYKLEPKRIRFVHPKQDKEANMVLIEGMKDASPELKLLPPLIVYDDQNQYTEELKMIYFGVTVEGGLKQKASHFVYILRCKDDTLYTGYTTDMKRRLQTHTEGKGAKYTRGRGPFQVAYVEEWEDKTEAMRREAKIKKLNRAEKIALIEEGGQERWDGTS